MRGKTHCAIGILSVIQASLLFKIPISLFNLILSAFFAILPDLDEPNSIVSDILLKKSVSKVILKLIIYLINIAIFFISIKINDNFYLSSLITFAAIFILETKLTHVLLRKLFLSLIFIFFAICIYILTHKISFLLFFTILAIFPWLKHRGYSHSIFTIIAMYFLLKQVELLINISNLSIFGTISYASHIFLGDLFTKSGIALFYPLSNKKYSLGGFKVGSFLNNTLELLFVLILVVSIIYSIIKI